MSPVYAKAVIDGKFWIVEKDDQKVGILKYNDQKKYVFSSQNTVTTFKNKTELFEEFGSDFFSKVKTTDFMINSEPHSIQGYPTSCSPFNPMFDVKRHLPLFTKSDKSKCMYCAGYYIIKFEKGWVRSFCPKLITLDRYEYEGPFKTELEMKNKLSHVTK